MKLEMPFISNVMLVGDKKKFITMLVTLKCDTNPEDGSPTNTLAMAAQDYFAKSEGKVGTFSFVSTFFLSFPD